MLFHDRDEVRDYNTEIRLFDANGKAKELWQENALGKALRLAGRDIRIQGITGRKSFVQRSHNLVTNVGHALSAGRVGGLGSYNPAAYLALGTSTTAAAVTDTTLGTEITTNGCARAAATVTQVTTSVTNDTVQLVHTWTATGAEAVTEEGIFDAATGGNLIAHQVFAVVNLASGDQIQITHKISF